MLRPIFVGLTSKIKDTIYNDLQLDLFANLLNNNIIIKISENNYDILKKANPEIIVFIWNKLFGDYLKTENNLDFKAADVISCLCMLRIQFLKVKDNNVKKNGEKNNKLSERFVNIMKLKKSIINFKDEFKVASNIRLPIEKSLQITTKQLDENYDRITANILLLKDMGEIIKGIHESQKICYMKMRNIQRLQLDWIVLILNMTLELVSLWVLTLMMLQESM
jgi:hypothetical protein